MASVHERLSEQFYKWELRGRGWQVFDNPVHPEPLFEPFVGHYIPDVKTLDDGRRPTFLSSLFRKVSQRPSLPSVEPEVEEPPEAKILVREPLIELQTSLPADFNITREVFEQFLLNISLCQEPVAFEVLGSHNQVVMQFATHPNDASLVRRQLQAHFLEGMFLTQEGTLKDTWDSCEGEDVLVVEFGLAREFVYPLESGKLDPFVGIVGALSELRPGQLGLFQVLFEPVREPWAENIARSVTHADGKPFFVNEPELAKAAEQKVARPLFAAVVRMAIRSEAFEQTLQVARDVAGSLRVFANPKGNELIPLANTDYPFGDHIEDMLRRQSRRSGMLLNSEELTGFVHLPSKLVRSPAFKRDAKRTKAAPAIVRGHAGVVLGNNPHGEKATPVRLASEQRVQHMHVMGVQGTGKSTFLFNLIRQDIENGEGLAVLDPHGDLVEQILGIIPPERIQDVVLVDPSDEEYSVGFNILSAHSDAEKRLLASDLVSVFERLSKSWGDQMGSVLQNAILAFLESDRGGTLTDLRRFLLEPPFRAKFLDSVRDPNIVYYWRTGFSQLAGNKSIGSVITRLNDFLAPKPIRYMVSQKENRLDFADIVDSGKIFLAKLPKGEIGKENSFLLGSLLVAKFQQMIMARQAQRAAARKDFFLYIDEFHNFITPSMAEILTDVRKYRLGMILAHQELRQLERDREVASAVLSMPYARVLFRVGDADARAMENGLSFFEARDLQNLSKGEAICRIEKADNDFNLTVPFPEPVDQEGAEAIRLAVIAASRQSYAAPRVDIEAAERAESESTVEEAEPVKAKRTRPVPPPVVEKKAEEIQKPPVQEKVDSSVTAEPFLKPEQPRLAARDLGRGGAQHQAIQKRIKAAADELDFQSLIEKPVLDGQGSVDLWLARGALSIACEISISTTIDHEVGNVAKCLKAGIQLVIVICLDDTRLRKIAAGVTGSLGAEMAARVRYFQPDQFIAHLQTLPIEPTEKKPTMRRGYRIKTVISELSPEKQKEKDAAAIRAIADSMRKK